MTHRRETFYNVSRWAPREPSRTSSSAIARPRALPIDEFLAGLDTFIEAHSPYTQNKVVCTTAPVQQRVRRAVQHTILTNEWRTWALNRWLD